MGLGMGFVQKITRKRARAKKEEKGAWPAAICCVGVGPATHWHCHQSTPSLLIYLLLTPPA
jgi:hypothetical protein